jgi:ribosomal protein L40E
VAEPRPLVCANCGATSPPDAASWRAYLDDDGNAVTFCPECAAREFGGAENVDHRSPR